MIWRIGILNTEGKGNQDFKELIKPMRAIEIHQKKQVSIDVKSKKGGEVYLKK